MGFSVISFVRSCRELMTSLYYVTCDAKRDDHTRPGMAPDEQRSRSIVHGRQTKRIRVESVVLSLLISQLVGQLVGQLVNMAYSTCTSTTPLDSAHKNQHISKTKNVRSSNNFWSVCSCFYILNYFGSICFVCLLELDGKMSVFCICFLFVTISILYSTIMVY